MQVRVTSLRAEDVDGVIVQLQAIGGDPAAVPQCAPFTITARGPAVEQLGELRAGMVLDLILQAHDVT